MKKRILGMALIAMSLVTFTGIAQKKTDNVNRNTTNTECTSQKDCRRGNFKRVTPFDKLNLTDAQKSQLKQIDRKHRDARRAEADSRRADRRRSDSARIENRRADKRAYLDEVKNVVGPDNYVIFLEESYIATPSDLKPLKPGTLKKHDKGGKRHGQRDRADKQATGK